MNELFNPDGHLTDEALGMLAADELEELSRLEGAEHLSFCDACVQKYTDFLCAGELMELPEELHETILRRLHRKTKLLLFNRYGAMAAAACFAILFWLTGVFSPQARTQPSGTGETEPSVSISERTASFTRSITDQLNGLLEKIQQPKEWFSK